MQRNNDLLSAMEIYGADVRGAMTRFLGDANLYAECIGMFMREESFPALGKALRDGECKKAFEAAHTLKGVAANLGLTPILETVNKLVEPLRAGRMENTEPLYDELMRKKGELAALLESIQQA